MINLLPKQQKKKIIAEYKMRLVTVSAILLLSAIIISTIVILPFYFTTKSTFNKAEADFENIKNSPGLVIDEESKVIIKDTDDKLKLLSGIDKQKTISKNIIDLVIENKMETISINSISYTDNKNNPLKDQKEVVAENVISVGGVAQNREELKSFVYRLMKVDSFRDVTVPISNYLKGEDLEFVITFSLTK